MPLSPHSCAAALPRSQHPQKPAAPCQQTGRSRRRAATTCTPKVWRPGHQLLLVDGVPPPAARHIMCSECFSVLLTTSPRPHLALLRHARLPRTALLATCCLVSAAGKPAAKSVEPSTRAAHPLPPRCKPAASAVAPPADTVELGHPPAPDHPSTIDAQAPGV